MNKAACFGFTFLFIPLVAFVNFEKSVAKSSPYQSWTCEKGSVFRMVVFPHHHLL
jgi:hypothetical protein